MINVWVVSREIDVYREFYIVESHCVDVYVYRYIYTYS